METVVRIADLTGVLFNALLGGLIARTKRFDLVGFVTLAILSGLGGGIIRDTLLQRGAPVALTDYAYLVTAVGGAVVAFVVPINESMWNRFFPYVDSVALGAWAAAGAQKTLELGFGWLPAVMLGTITAVGGGALRDIVLQRIPRVFGGNTLYATSAVIASAAMVVLWHTWKSPWATVTAIVIGATITLLAMWRGWRLPAPYDWRFSRGSISLPRPRWLSRQRRSSEPK